MVSIPKNSVALAAAALAAPLLACGCNPAARAPGASMAVSVQAAPWSFAGVDGTALTSDHYRIHTTTANRDVLTYLPGFMENAHRNYLMLGSISGTVPGTPLPGGTAILPLNWDPFTNMVLGYLNTPIFDNFLAMLDSEGTGWALFDTLGPITIPSGFILHFAYALNNPWDFASNAVDIEITL